MIRFENTDVVGWEAAIRGMRNPMNSWEKSDSCTEGEVFYCSDYCDGLLNGDKCKGKDGSGLCIGPNDLTLMKKLRNAGTDHRKFMRMIEVYVDITAPLYWWKEFDTYKVGTVANSCSTMHKIADKEFELNDFSHEHLIMNVEQKGFIENQFSVENPDDPDEYIPFTDVNTPLNILELIVDALNINRDLYIKTKDKKYWWQMIQLLPSSYNQKRTVMMSYEVLANVYKSRKDHKLDEWRKDYNKSTTPGIGIVSYGPSFCDWIKELPHSELITGDFV